VKSRQSTHGGHTHPPTEPQSHGDPKIQSWPPRERYWLYNCRRAPAGGRGAGRPRPSSESASARGRSGRSAAFTTVTTLAWVLLSSVLAEWPCGGVARWPPPRHPDSPRCCSDCCSGCSVRPSGARAPSQPRPPTLSLICRRGLRPVRRREWAATATTRRRKHRARRGC
jgi:hypothetical protein